MSEFFNMIALFPPKINTREERKDVRGFVCPECKGNKTFSNRTGYEEWETKECPYCKGAGKVMATVRVHWLPDEENKRENGTETGK